MSELPWCDISVAENKPENGLFSVHFQLPGITINLVAKDLLFAQKVLDFVAETRGNPAYRDIRLGNGVYRTMPEKNIDLSSSFLDTKVVILKNGEYDAAYLVRVTPSTSCAMTFDLSDKLLDSVLREIREIVDEYGPATEQNKRTT